MASPFASVVSTMDANEFVSLGLVMTHIYTPFCGEIDMAVTVGTNTRLDVLNFAAGGLNCRAMTNQTYDSQTFTAVIGQTEVNEGVKEEQRRVLRFLASPSFHQLGFANQDVVDMKAHEAAEYETSQDPGLAEAIVHQWVHAVIDYLNRFLGHQLIRKPRTQSTMIVNPTSAADLSVQFGPGQQAVLDQIRAQFWVEHETEIAQVEQDFQVGNCFQSLDGNTCRMAKIVEVVEKTVDLFSRLQARLPARQNQNGPLSIDAILTSNVVPVPVNIAVRMLASIRDIDLVGQ